MRKSAAMTRVETIKPELTLMQRPTVKPAPVRQAVQAQPGGLAGWLMRHWNGRGARAKEEKRLRVVEQISLGGKRQLSLVECDGLHFLVGSSEHGVQAMTQVQKVESC